MQENAVTRRLDTLYEQWYAFCEQPQARLFLWYFQSTEFPILRAFFSVEEEDNARTDDLFLQLNTPFADPQKYGQDLIWQLQEIFRQGEEFEQQQAEQAGNSVDQPAENHATSSQNADAGGHDAKDTGFATGDATGDVEVEGEDDDFPELWQAPAPEQNEEDRDFFFRALKDWCAHYADCFDHLVLLLQPDRVLSPKKYIRWLQELSDDDFPEQVRILIAADVQDERVKSLQEACLEDGFFHWTLADLDMDQGLNELAEQVAEGPEGEFRKHFVALATAGAKGDMKLAESEAQKAQAICAEQNWPQLETPLHMNMASAWLGQKDHEKALESYDAAVASAQKAREQEESGADKLEMQAKMGKAGVQIVLKHWETAALGYEEVAAMADVAEDKHIEVEAWRMAGYCWDKKKSHEAAYECGEKTLACAEKFSAEERQQTTALFAAEMMDKIAGKWTWSGTSREETRVRIAEVLGEDWEQQLREKRDL